MVLVDSGSAAAASSSIQQTQQDSILLMIALLKKLLAGLEPKDQQGYDDSIDDLKEDINQACADSVKALVDERGSEEVLDGEFKRVYRAEGYTLSADVGHPSEQPVYTVTTEKGDVFAFQQHPSGEGYQFLETQGSLSDAEKTVLLEVLLADLERKFERTQTVEAKPAEVRQGEVKPDVRVNRTQPVPQLTATPQDSHVSSPDVGIAKVKAEVELMQDFAPVGSKAVVVADRLLEQRDQVVGAKYAFERHQDGSITIGRFSETHKGRSIEIARMNPDGKITAYYGASSTPQQDFSVMFGKMKPAELGMAQSAETAKSPQAKTQVKAKPDKPLQIGSR